MIMNKNSKRYRGNLYVNIIGFGFVTFESYECVDYVFRDYSNHFIKGNWVLFFCNIRSNVKPLFQKIST